MASFSFVFQNGKSLIIIVTVPIVLNLLIDLFVFFYAKSIDNVAIVIFLFLLSLFPLTVFSVNYLRFALLKEKARSMLWPRWEQRNLIYLGYVILSTAPLAIVNFAITPLYAGPPMRLGLIMALIISALLSLYFLVRLSFVFPATAIGGKYNLLQAWRDTRGQGFRLFAALALVLIPVEIFAAVLSAIVMKASVSIAERGWAFALLFEETLHRYLSLIFILPVISSAFHLCTGRGSASQSADNSS
jgi:hypothetical protein